MITKYKNFTVSIAEDSNYALNSADNTHCYAVEYFDGKENAGRYYPTVKYGIRIFEECQELSSAIICEFGSATTIHENSFLIHTDLLLICCSDKVYSFKLPYLKFNWKRRLDPATYFGIYLFNENYVIHGELFTTRIDKDGEIIWKFGARDIFVTQDGTEGIEIFHYWIKVKDWEGNEYILDEDGGLIG